MASNRKKVQPGYNDSGWGDSISVSKKAREELAEVANNAEQERKEQEIAEAKQKTARLKEYNNYNSNQKKPAPGNQQKPRNKEYEEVTNQVDQINHEINKAVSEIESVLERFVNQLWFAVSNFFLAFYNLFLKMVLLVFVAPLKNAGKFSSNFLNMINESLTDLNDWLGGAPKSRKVNTKKVTASLKHAVNQQQSNVQQQEARPESKLSLEKEYPAVFDGIVFSELALKGIVFLNIKNITMYDVNKKEFSVEEEQELLDTAILEINNCARLAKSLPSPTKGKYINKSMVDILENANMSDLKMFLQYVYTHPKPFIERQLRLSEAFATWAHKGAPV